MPTLTDDQIHTMMAKALRDDDRLYTAALARIALGMEWRDLRRRLKDKEVSELLSHDPQTAREELASMPGRRPLPEADTASARIEIRVRPDERELWLKAADERDQTLAEWMRDVLNRSAKRST